MNEGLSFLQGGNIAGANQGNLAKLLSGLSGVGSSTMGAFTKMGNWLQQPQNALTVNAFARGLAPQSPMVQSLTGLVDPAMAYEQRARATQKMQEEQMSKLLALLGGTDGAGVLGVDEETQRMLPLLLGLAQLGGR